MSLRPGGVTGIAILFLIAAIILIPLGLICVAMTDFIYNFWNSNIGNLLAELPIVGGTLAVIESNTWIIIGVFSLIFGALGIVTCFGLLKLKKWGYWLCIIISIPFIIVILGIIFIWYLRKDEVKAAFDIM